MDSNGWVDGIAIRDWEKDTAIRLIKEVNRSLKRRASLIEFDRGILSEKLSKVLSLLGEEEWEV